jgi:hypothetical protein
MSDTFGKRLPGKSSEVLERIKAGTYRLPSDVTKADLLEYKKIAEETIQVRKVDKLGEQARRLEIIESLLKKYFPK